MAKGGKWVNTIERPLHDPFRRNDTVASLSRISYQHSTVEFTLTYRGPLPGNGSAKEKQTIREYLHPQLKELWDHPPLNAKHQLLTDQLVYENEEIALLERRNGFDFVALVSSKFGLAAELRIIFLRNGPPGGLVKHGGDLDNRLKTLFDALALPNKDQIAQAPPRTQTSEKFFCLLEDDALIHGFNVAADRLLAATQVHVHQSISPTHPELEVLLLIQVVTRTTTARIWNMDL